MEKALCSNLAQKNKFTGDDLEFVSERPNSLLGDLRDQFKVSHSISWTGFRCSVKFI